MNTNLNATEVRAAVLNALDIKIAAHLALNQVSPDDVTKSKKKISVEVAQLLIDCEKTDFAAWVESAPCKSIMRAVNFLSGVAHKDETLGRDLIAQSIILTARTLKTDELPLELVKFQVTKGYECDELSTITKGVSVRKAERKMSPKTALSMISNRAGKHGYLQYLGMVTRSSTKAVCIDKQNAFYKLASKLLSKGKGVADDALVTA